MGIFDKLKTYLDTSTNPTVEADDIMASPSNLLPFQMIVDDVFPTTTQGKIVATGKILAGCIRIGSMVNIGNEQVEVVGVENFNKRQPMTHKDQVEPVIDYILGAYSRTASEDGLSTQRMYVGMPAATYGVTGDFIGVMLPTNLSAENLKGATLTGPATEVMAAPPSSLAQSN